MSLELLAHPFSSYSQKVLIALYENATPFEFRMLDAEHPENGAALMAHWSIGKFPLLLDAGRAVFESTIIIEYLARHYPGTVALLPQDPEACAEVRLLDRLFDSYVMAPMQAVVDNALCPVAQRHEPNVTRARAALEQAYDWFERRLAGRRWAAGDDFTLADCAAAPALFYADWVHPIPAGNSVLRGYLARLLERPSFARCVDAARPYRPLFPLGAPDRD
ncbi:MAG: glutathione S-transferase family protein [Haliea sp.]|nr:glutathione S-transferase family protein [Haliea sp.]